MEIWLGYDCRVWQQESQIKMKKINKKYLINAPVGKVWESLVNPKLIVMWGADPAEMSDREGAEFKLWGGDVHGKNTKVTVNKKLVQDWYGGDWSEPSRATFTLTEKGDKTILELVHKNVPDKDAKDIDSGWDDYYLGPMKEYLERNS